LLDKLPKGQKKVLDAVKITDLLCDNPLFEAYGQFGKFSCIKVLEDSDHRLKFMEEFTGSTSISKLLSKKSIFDRKKKICVDITQACRQDEFDDSKLIGKKRNKCAACTLIANDIDTAKRARNTTAVTLRSILDNDENSFCDTLGFTHTPYGWLESLCYEMMEEKLESILEVVAFHEQVARTGFTPDQTMPQMMCEEFYGCDKYLEQTKKPKQIKANRKSAGSKAMKSSKNNIEL